MYVHDSLVPTIILSAPFNLEFIVLAIVNSCTNCKHCVGLFYRPPSAKSELFNYFCTSLQYIDPSYFSNFVLLGDFNIDFLNSNHTLYPKLSDLMDTFNLSQVVPSYAHVNPSGNKFMIDLALLSDPSQLVDCIVIPPLANSDHFGIQLTIKQASAAKQMPRTVWSYARADFQKACDMINKTNWDNILTNDIHTSVINWHSMFFDIIENVSLRKPSQKMQLSMAHQEHNHINLQKKLPAREGSMPW